MNMIIVYSQPDLTFVIRPSGCPPSPVRPHVHQPVWADPNCPLCTDPSLRWQQQRLVPFILLIPWEKKKTLLYPNFDAPHGIVE